MFEGQINKKPFAPGRESDVLRQFRWTDLVARLSATRELRDELAKGEVGGFEAFGEVRREHDSESKQGVYHAALADGKSAALETGRAANGAAHGDREK